MTKLSMRDEGLCNCGALRQAARYLTAAYDQLLADSGLRTTQFSILFKLAARGTQAITELSALMAMDRTTVGRNLKLLERDGLVRYRPAPMAVNGWSSLRRRSKEARDGLSALAAGATAVRVALRCSARRRAPQHAPLVLRTGLDPWGHERTLPNRQ